MHSDDMENFTWPWSSRECTVRMMKRYEILPASVHDEFVHLLTKGIFTC